jgi:hypothetical protein
LGQKIPLRDLVCIRGGAGVAWSAEVADAEDPGCADAAEDPDVDVSEAGPAEAVGAVDESDGDSAAASVRDAEERVDGLGPRGEDGDVRPEDDSVGAGPLPHGRLGEGCPEDDARSWDVAGADPGVDSPEPDADGSVSGSPPA